jgi:hypothetical protein
MAELWLPRYRYDDAKAKVRVGVVAGRQFGRVSGAQLRLLGVDRRMAFGWSRAGHLFPELPGVYAVGHPGRTEESALFAAVLYAGPGAALCGLTAALHRGLVKWLTASAIEVSTPRRCRSLTANDPENGLRRAIAVRDRRPLARAAYHGIPTVPIPQILLGLAATGDVELTRFALSQLDFMRVLNVKALQNVCGRGIPGSAILREAIGNPQPLYTRARSKFEIRLVQVCEETGIPLPELNVKIGRITPDALWREWMVVVGCDGEGNHGTWRQRKRDLRDDLTLRSLGFLPIRYTYDQLDDPWAIHADLMPILIERQGRASLA